MQDSNERSGSPGRGMQRIWVQVVAVLLVSALGAALRLYDLKNVPAGLYCDEAAIGYNAHAIATAGIDENGRSYPLFFWSFGGYKNPVYIYTAAVGVRLLGLDEFTTRLPAALFGTGTIIAMFFLGRALVGPWVGIFAAILLAICPWHLHFSRIAFELISFPLLFVIGTTLLVRYTQGRRTLPAAMLFFGLSPYAYAIAAVFVPLFLVGFSLLYMPTLLRRWRETFLALVVIVAVAIPAGWFYHEHQSAGTMYFRRTTTLDPGQTPTQQAKRLLQNYQAFFSPSFLFEQGDPLTRHAVRGKGELLQAILPFLLLGTALMALRPDRFSKLLLWWLALYPVGASLMNEIPSASRSIIGAPVFCLLAAVGLGGALRALEWVLRWRPLVLVGQAAAIVGVGYFMGPETWNYLRTYFVEYPKYSAPTPGGFQYGFRDAINYMESERKNYDLMMITTTDGNQPQIFPMFYRAVDPREWVSTHDPGYLILDPTEYRRYLMNQRILYALQPSDLEVFSDYTVKRRIMAPGGQVAFDIAEVRARKRFLTDWLVLGPFQNDQGAGVRRDFIDVTELKRGQYEGVSGPITWRPISPQFVRVDLNQFFAMSDARHVGNPEDVCAYAVTTLQSDSSRSAFLELAGSDDYAQLWLNGKMLTPGPLMLQEAPKRRPIDLVQGDNVLLVKSCESIGSWYFTVRLTDDRGQDITGITIVPDLPRVHAPTSVRAEPPADEVQLIEGFASIVRYAHTQDRYGDYRGGTQSWWAYVRDHGADVVWRTAPCPQKRTTTFAFTASMGEEEGKAELWLNDKYVFTFDLGDAFTSRTWQQDGYQLSFTNKLMVAGNSGIFLLTVPPDVVTAGQGIELRVVPVDGQDGAWFMVKEYTDTIEHEHLTPASVVTAVRDAWTDVNR
jgi:4-amino-4-deoxy-L-arabinose transferase-like glycosyltransferase